MTLMTLHDLAAEGVALYLHCNNCGRGVEVDPLTIPLPPETPVYRVREHCRCSRCGSREVQSLPAPHGKTSIAEMRARYTSPIGGPAKSK